MGSQERHDVSAGGRGSGPEQSYEAMSEFVCLAASRVQCNGSCASVGSHRFGSSFFGIPARVRFALCPPRPPPPAQVSAQSGQNVRALFMQLFARAIAARDDAPPGVRVRAQSGPAACAVAAELWSSSMLVFSLLSRAGPPQMARASLVAAKTAAAVDGVNLDL